MSLLAVLLLFITACKQENNQRTIELPGGKKATFLNLTQAQQAITKDDIEGYFSKVSRTDIEIQSKNIYPDSASRSKILADYKSFLRDDVKDFTAEDRDFLGKILKEIGRVLYKIDPDILDQDINLIKVGGRHYGPSVFYTRENNIIIPAYELAKREELIMRSILIHEVFHIYSRFHPEKRQELYAMIGFKPLGIAIEDIEMPDEIRNTILLNPDGIDNTYYIDLSDEEGNTYQCIMLTSSEFHQYSAANVGYFPHLTTNFFPIEPNAVGGYSIMTNELGMSPLNLRSVYRSLWDQIGDNTMYIIHPDEILADNFSLWVTKSIDSESVEVKSDGERDILHEMEQIIQSD